MGIRLLPGWMRAPLHFLLFGMRRLGRGATSVISRRKQRHSAADTWVSINGHAYGAGRTEQPTVTFSRAHTLGQVRAVLRRENIAFSVKEPWGDDPVVSIEQSRLTEVGHLLGSTKVNPPLYVRPAPPASPQHVATVWGTSSGHLSTGIEAGVRLASKAPEAVNKPPWAGPVDAVFTWVDGSDPAWQDRRDRRLASDPSTSSLHAESANEARYASMDELRFALRSIHTYAPWFRTIFLVTDRQVPDWLDTEHPRIRVVDHRDIFTDPKVLPTFNSHAIESQLHHIEDLSEQFVYFNDDIFLARATPPSRFFDETGRPKVFFAADLIPPGPAGASDPPVVAAAKNNRKVLERLTGFVLTQKLQHVPHPQVRSLTGELERELTVDFARTASSPFRDRSDLSVASSLAPHFSYATNRAIRGHLKHFYADVASLEVYWRLPELLEQRNVDVICLNATTGGSARRAAWAHRFLTRYFPVRAPWEIAEAN